MGQEEVMTRNGKTREPEEGHVSGQANEPLSGLPHTLTGDQCAIETGANVLDGLNASEAKSRLDKYGANELDDGPGVSPVKILVRQVANAMTLVKRTTRPFPLARFSDPIL